MAQATPAPGTGPGSGLGDGPGSSFDDGPDNAHGEFVALFRDYYNVIFTAAYTRLSDREEAEDITNAVFATAWQRHSEKVDAFKLPWLYSTLRNMIGNEYRRRSRTMRRVERLKQETPTAYEPAAFNREYEHVHAIISKMAPADRELIIMAHWEELSREEMAQIIGCTEATVRTRLKRAREKLKLLLAAEDAREGKVSA